MAKFLFKNRVIARRVVKRPASEAEQPKDVARRCAQKVGLTAEKAGLTAEQPPSGAVPRARNAFQLFYADALRNRSCANARAASQGWSKMSDARKQKWVDEAIQGKQLQLRAKANFGIPAKALTLSSPTAVEVVESPTPVAGMVTINTGNW